MQGPTVAAPISSMTSLHACAPFESRPSFPTRPLSSPVLSKSCNSLLSRSAHLTSTPNERTSAGALLTLSAEFCSQKQNATLQNRTMDHLDIAKNTQDYIHILPRTQTESGIYKKRCETCHIAHDGSFGAGRFCSSRCARTVGGLAHRKKRMMERNAKQSTSLDLRSSIRKSRKQYESQSFVTASTVDNVKACFTPKQLHKGKPNSSRSAMSINSLLNPIES